MSGQNVLITAGIDVGSSAIKTVVMEDRGAEGQRILAGFTERLRRRDPLDVATGTFEKALLAANLTRGDVDYIATTGEGENVPFRTGHFYGMTTHARGGLYLDPQVRAVVDIGALHTRAVLMDERAKVLGYRMTSQCASGSGQFLENICRYLGVTVDEIGPLSLRSEAPESCSSICAVLAETDVINMVSRGVAIPDILRGIHDSMAGRYVKLAIAAGAKGAVLITGGLSRDAGLLAAMQDQSKDLDIRTHENSVLAGAIGAALWGGFRARKLRNRGLSLGSGAS
jgi:benzoyl-CoA reductase subunit D